MLVNNINKLDNFKKKVYQRRCLHMNVLQVYKAGCLLGDTQTSSLKYMCSFGGEGSSCVSGTVFVFWVITLATYIYSTTKVEEIIIANLFPMQNSGQIISLVA